ncbi:uncharacterized protein EDB91DRAFT_1349804, partial [Suillus paluster]|uniref:uncharacterized protein n=1 Tax=Suillus paluster TaxID=48578 RepID=UPI001B8786F9
MVAVLSCCCFSLATVYTLQPVSNNALYHYFENQVNDSMASGQTSEIDVEYVMTRKRKRPAYNSQGEGALDLLHSKSSINMCEPFPSLIPPIATLTPARNTTAAQNAVTVERFIRQVMTKVPEPPRKRKLLTVKLQDTSISSPDGAYIQQQATPPARNGGLTRNGLRFSKMPVRDRKPMTLTQRLTRAAILSHVETDNILQSDAISSSRPPLDFVPFRRFETPPSSPRKDRVKRSAYSRDNRHRRRKRIPGQPDLERSGCLPLTFIPLREAEDAYAAKFS